MNREELKNYLNAQLREIEKYKWIQSERENHDIGFQRAAFEWIAFYGAQFHQQWESSNTQRQVA